MNVKLSIARLPEAIANLIASSRAVQPQLERGESLDRIVGSSEWADRWLSNAEPKTIGLLTTIVAKFVGLPFELEQLVTAGAQKRFTGAEIRLGVARLRRDGIVFAVRKAWGNQLFYVPTDMIPCWQRRLLPVHAILLSAGASRPKLDSDKRYRLPLSLELLLAWHSVADRPIAFTAKGALNRPSIAKLIAPMRIAPQELEPISFAYPDAEQLPRQAALAIDLGLCAGVLVRTADDIRIDEWGLRNWITLTVRKADARLHEILVQRYASADPQLHLAASAVLSLPAEQWMETRLFAKVGSALKADAWLSVLESFGWVERGFAAGAPVFRILADFPSDEAEQNGGAFIVQPDGEIIVTPDVGLAARWTLERTAERIAADTLFIYRLSRAACAKAVDAGYSRQELIDFLESGSGEPLPSQVTDALNDWYACLGKTKFEEVMLLRTDSPAVAKLLLDDPGLASHKLELVGDKDFIIDAAERKAVETKLIKLGYPPAATKREKLGDAVQLADVQEPGWIYRPFTLGFYEADPSIPDLEELFPGILDIPSVWLREPRAYHASTREALVQRAIGWQASLLVRKEGQARQFVPKAIERDGADWSALGHWREEADGPQELVKVSGHALAEIMINLPDMDGIETH